MSEPFKRNQHIFSIRLGKFEIIFQKIVAEGGIDLFKSWLRDSDKTSEEVAVRNEAVRGKWENDTPAS